MTDDEKYHGKSWYFFWPLSERKGKSYGTSFGLWRDRRWICVGGIGNLRPAHWADMGISALNKKY